jgi:quercetin dioxygenase-like cupin family protein
MSDFTTEILLEPSMTSPVPPAIVPAESLIIGTGRTRRFVGRDHGAGLSYFFVDNEPGQGPDLHWHPYTETWVVIEGTARITIGDTTLVATEGDTATVAAGVWHGFKNAGEGRLRVLCMHASPVIIQTWAE